MNSDNITKKDVTKELPETEKPHTDAAEARGEDVISSARDQTEGEVAEASEVIEKKQAMIIVCGPPHSGKSVFFGGLKEHLPRRNTRLFRACPDGEGTWSQKADEGVAQDVRRKGGFTSAFMEFALKGIEKITSKRVLVDVGGIRSKENGDIFRRATHAVVLCRSDKAGEKAAWEAFAKENGLIVMASLDSALQGEESAYIDEEGTIRGQVVGLERGQEIKSQAIELLASRIMEETQGEGGSELIAETNGIRVVSFDNLADQLKVPSKGRTIKRPDKGYDLDIDLPWWTGKKIRAGVEFVANLDPETPVLLDGGHPAVLYAGVTAAIPQKEIWYTDETNYETGRGKVESLELADKPSDTLEWKVEEREDYTLVEVGWKKDVQWTMGNFAQRLADLKLPNVNPEKGVVISGKLAYLLFGSITRSYQYPAKWVGIFTPQQKEDAGMKWPSMVVFSNDTGRQVGDYVDTPQITSAIHDSEAKALLNPKTKELIKIAQSYIADFRTRAPHCKFELGGSLASDTLLEGNNDVDIRILVPECEDMEGEIKSISGLITDLVKFQKERRVDTPPNDKYGVIHEERKVIDGIDVDLEVSIRPEKDYVGYAQFQGDLPSELLEYYVRNKADAAKESIKSKGYKELKAKFYEYTRELYRLGLIFKGGFIRNQAFWDLSRQYFPEVFGSRSIEASPETARYSFGVLDPRPEDRYPDAKEHNEAIFGGKRVLGIEVTIPALAQRCALGNIDPQHTGSDVSTAAVEVALTHPLPEGEVTMVTIRPDLDSFGSMAILNLRAKGQEIKGSILECIQKIAASDKFNKGAWPGRQPLPTRENPWAGSTAELGAIGAMVIDDAKSVAERVSAVEEWLLMGKEPAEYRTKAERERLKLVEALEKGEIEIKMIADGQIALIVSSHPRLAKLGYTQAPVVVVSNSEFSQEGRKKHTKITIAQYEEGHVDLSAAFDELNSIDPTVTEVAKWGGSPTVGGSPQGLSSELPLETIIDTVIKHLIK